MLNLKQLSTRLETSDKIVPKSLYEQEKQMVDSFFETYPKYDKESFAALYETFLDFYSKYDKLVSKTSENYRDFIAFAIMVTAFIGLAPLMITTYEG